MLTSSRIWFMMNSYALWGIAAMCIGLAFILVAVYFGIKIIKEVKG